MLHGHSTASRFPEVFRRMSHDLFRVARDETDSLKTSVHHSFRSCYESLSWWRKLTSFVIYVHFSHLITDFDHYSMNSK